MNGDVNNGAALETVEPGSLLRKRLTNVGCAQVAATDSVRAANRRFKFTKASVDKLAFEVVGQRNYYDTELRGFALRVGKRTKVFFVERSIRGAEGNANSNRVTIGAAGEITTDDARQQARELLAAMAKGINPIAERKQEAEKRREVTAQSERDNVSLQNLWNEFKADRQGKLKERTLNGYQAILDSVFSGKKVKRRSFAFENWMERPLKSISSRDVRDLHRRIGKECGPAYANLAMRVFSSLMSYAVRCEWIPKNPVDTLKRGGWFQVKARRNVLPDDALPAWFKAVDDLRYDPEHPTAAVGADYLELVLLTGLRRSEASQLTWDRVDFQKKVLTVVDTKNSDALVLPLSDHLVTLLKRRKEQTGDKQWVFPSPNRKGTGKPLAEPRFAVDLVVEKCGIVHSIHDLRRTFVSKAARFLPYAVLKSLVNHRAEKKGDVTLDHYVRLDAEDLRPHLNQMTDFFLAHKAKGQGMKISTATA